jgi:Cu/Ag efflux pump CusA
MISHLVALALRIRAIVILLAVVCLVGGLYAYKNLDI